MQKTSCFPPFPQCDGIAAVRETASFHSLGASRGVRPRDMDRIAEAAASGHGLCDRCSGSLLPEACRLCCTGPSSSRTLLSLWNCSASTLFGICLTGAFLASVRCAPGGWFFTGHASSHSLTPRGAAFCSLVFCRSVTAESSQRGQPYGESEECDILHDAMYLL